MNIKILSRSKPIVFFLACIMFISSSWLSSAQGKVKKFEIGVLITPTRTCIARNSSFDRWWKGTQGNIHENNWIVPQKETTYAYPVGIHAAFFFNPSWGVQVQASYFANSQHLTSLYSYRLWNNGQIVERMELEADGSERLQVTNISLNLLRRVQFAKRLAFSISGGPTLSIRAFQADTFAFIADTSSLSPGVEVKDFFQIPLTIKQSWLSLELNMGAGFQVDLSKTIALFTEARLFYGPEKELLWKWLGGTYSGLQGQLMNWPISQEKLDDWYTSFGPDRSPKKVITVDPFHISYCIGLKFRI